MSASAAYLRKLERQRGAAGSAMSGGGGGESKRLNNKAKQTWRPVSKAILNGFVSKYQNRRSQLLKSVNPYRSPINISRIHTKNNVWSNGRRLKIYDIVSVVDSLDGVTKYFGQINALVTDSYAKSYIFLVWLVPKQGQLPTMGSGERSSTTPAHTSFLPADFVHGIAEERPIPVECCDFESTCPLLPRYMRGWSREELAREQVRAELALRVREIRSEPILPNARDDFKKLV